VTQVDSHPKRILVTDTSRGSAITIIRSLGRRGWQVIAADSNPNSLGFRSRYVHETLVYPPPDTDAKGMAAALLKAVEERRVDLLIPVTDAVILPVIEQRNAFERFCKVAIPDDIESLGIVTDKLKTLELANSLGVPTPRTKLVDTAAEALEAAEEIGFPLVLKPQSSRLYTGQSSEGFNVTYAENPDDLVMKMGRFEGRCPVLLQEYYIGTGHGVELLTWKGEPLAAFEHKRLREIPISGGASSFREGVPLDSARYDYATRLLKAIKWTGLAMVEFKVGSQGPKLMEINGRIWGSLPLAVHSGVDFPAMLVDVYLNDKRPNGVNNTYKVGVRSRNLELDMLWIASVMAGQKRYPFMQMPSRMQAVAAFLGLFNPTYKFDILSWEDPRPGMAEIPKVIRKLTSKVKDSA
jgi:predicted ATP-grasp superfamily ATP-dependent carboligase